MKNDIKQAYFGKDFLVNLEFYLYDKHQCIMYYISFVCLLMTFPDSIINEKRSIRCGVI